MDKNIAGSCNCCSSSCERTGVWRKPVTSRFDFALDLSLDPAADRGCGDPISAKTKSSKSETKEEMMEVEEHNNSHKHHTAKINLFEPDGVEARVCSRHVEQAVRERLYLFGEDCNYSIWWFPRPDYASTVWRTDEGEEGSGLVVGDPDIVSLAKQKDSSSKKNRSHCEMYQNIRPTPPIQRREADSSSTSTKDEDDGIGEELKNLILNDTPESIALSENSIATRGRPLSSPTAGAVSPAQINRDLFMAKRTGILGTKKPVVKSSAMTRNALSFDFENTSTTSKQSAQAKYLAPAPNHRLRWLKRREVGGPGCGLAVRNYHRHEIAKNYSTSSPYSTNAMLATTPSGRVGQGLPVNLPQMNITPGGGAGGYGCGGALRVWSDLKNISHLYHVVPLDQSEAEITLEELSHPDVFSDSRIGCSIQLIHSSANRNDQSEDEIIDGGDEDIGEAEEETEPMEMESLDTPEQRRHLRRSTHEAMFSAVPSPQIPLRNNRVEQLRRSMGGLRRSTDNTNTSIVPSAQSTGSAPSTPTMARLRPAIREEVPRRREEEDEELMEAALEAQRQEEANNRRQGSAIRMHRRRSIVSASDSIIAPQVKVVSTTTPLAYKRRGGEELLQQLFEAGVHCRSRHKYVSFVDVPMPSIAPAVGWPGLEEFLGRFRQMCTMSGVAIVNESRDRRRRVFVGSEHSTSSQNAGSSEAKYSSSGLSRDIKGKQSDETNQLLVEPSHHRRSSLRISSSSIASSAVIQSSDSSSANTSNSSSLDWQLIRERAAMIVDFRKPLTNYGSFWNEHYFRRRLSMPIHGTVLTARSDPVFACKNPDVIAHYLGEANTAGRVAPDLSDGRQPCGGTCKPLPPPLVPTDPTIVHQSYTLTFYPDLDGGFSASLEYLTLHSPNCSVSALDHIRRRFIVKHANKFQQRYFNTSAEERQAMEATYATIQRVPIGRVNELPTNVTPTRQTFGGQANWNGSIWRSIEDVVAGLKVPESSKSTHTYQQDNLERVLEFLKERTCNTLAQEERLYKQRQEKKANNTEMASECIFRFVVDEDEDQDEYQLLRLFGLLEDVEKNVQKCLVSERFDASQIEYDFGAPVRWTFLPSLQFYQTRITV